MTFTNFLSWWGVIAAFWNFYLAITAPDIAFETKHYVIGFGLMFCSILIKINERVKP